MYVEAVGIYHSYRQTKAEGLSQWLLSARIAKQQSNSSMEVVMDSAQHSSSVLGGSPPLRTSARILRSGASAGCSCRILRQEISAFARADLERRQIVVTTRREEEIGQTIEIRETFSESSIHGMKYPLFTSWIIRHHGEK